MTGSPLEQQHAQPAPLSQPDLGAARSLGAAEAFASALSLIWGVVYGLGDRFFGSTETEFWSDPLLSLWVLILPILLIWACALNLRSSRIASAESAFLTAQLNQMQTNALNDAQTGTAASGVSMVQKLDEIAETARKTETALATFHSIRMETNRPSAQTRPPPPPQDEQGALALGTTAEDMTPPLQVDQFIRALNFPETADDEIGFTALRLALQDRKASQVIQAAQDILTLLSQDGIYMDDLHPDMARPEIWRHFAKGSRGREVAALGGVRDRSSLALTAARMKQDPIFRDAAHHFLRRFDQMIVNFEKTASDAEVAALGETRTARAFMLLGRVAGTFD
ncbi:hypothetical protein [Epibacterium ulvae]|uniref:hypothetical protein n=1 Tax=Epibacterium ulvae TaxID=1156985 RepID=UPI00249250A9|nr:hypothetical protein [Epibacterium ulvae]